MATLFENWKYNLSLKYLKSDAELAEEFLAQMDIYLKDSKEPTVRQIREAIVYVMEAIKKIDWPREFSRFEIHGIFLASESILEKLSKERLEVKADQNSEPIRISDIESEGELGSVQSFNLHPYYASDPVSTSRLSSLKVGEPIILEKPKKSEEDITEPTKTVPGFEGEGPAPEQLTDHERRL